MPRFFFHVANQHEVLSDDEGVEADDAEQAIQEAVAAMVEMRDGGELPDTNGEWTLVVHDDKGNELRRIPV